MERIQGMITGFGFIGVALFLKSLLSTEKMIISALLILFLILGPTIFSHREIKHNRKFVKN